MTQHMRNRPGLAPGAAPESDVASHPQATGETRPPHLTRTEVLDALPAYVLILKTGHGRISRRVYLTLAAADRAAQRHRAHGHAVTLELVTLTPAAGGAR